MSRKMSKKANYELTFSEIFPRLLNFTGAKNQYEFAKLMGFSNSNVSNSKRRNKIPTDWLIKLAIEKDFSIDELVKKVFGKRPPYLLAERKFEYGLSSVAEEKVEYITSSFPKRRVEDRYYVLLPLFIKGKKEIQEFQFMRIYALKSWLEPQLKASPDQAFITIMEGDSMSPTINSGDILICDGEHGSIKDVPVEDVIYILQLEGRGPTVRRIQGLPGKFFRVIADNPKFEPFIIPADSNCHIIGRVIWVIKKF